MGTWRKAVDHCYIKHIESGGKHRKDTHQGIAGFEKKLGTTFVISARKFLGTNTQPGSGWWYHARPVAAANEAWTEYLANEARANDLANEARDENRASSES